MLENAEERELKGRLQAAGVHYWGDRLVAIADGAGFKSVRALGGGRFRVTVPVGFIEVPGSYAGIREGLERAASECGYAIAGDGFSGDYSHFVLTPRA